MIASKKKFRVILGIFTVLSFVCLVVASPVSALGPVSPPELVDEWWDEGVLLTAIETDAEGNTYALNGADSKIQKFDTDGNLVTEWGSNGDGDGEFGSYGSITVDLSGNVYLADSNNKRVQKFDSDGNFITKWGSEGSGNGQFDDYWVVLP